MGTKSALFSLFSIAHASLYADQRYSQCHCVSSFKHLEDYFEGFPKGQQKYNNHFIQRMLFDKDLALNF